MSRFISAASMAFLLFSAYPQRNGFTAYRAVEAYEVQPGILAFPTYAEDGQVCEIGIERRHYSPEVIKLDPSLSREEIDKTVDDLAPAAVRGQKSDGPLNDLMVVAGGGMTTIADYENVTVQIYSGVIGVSGKEKTVENVAAVIRWKNRKCK
jgi:hypothetical protein